MKKTLLLLAIFGAPQFLSAQPFGHPPPKAGDNLNICDNPLSQIDIHANNIQARILNGGDLFTDFSNGAFFPNPDPNSTNNPATIFAAGIWLGGIDAGGNLKLATVDYRGDGYHDYSAGPLGPDGITDAFTCANWDRHFRVTGSEVAAFLDALPLSADALKSQFLSIAGWPGRGNPYFSSVWGYDLPFTNQALAPFFDANLDGNYDPLSGDYPAVLLQGMAPFVPAEIIWCVFNDQNGGGAHTNSTGKQIQAEIQLTVWAFNCLDQPVINNTIFTSHKIINRASEPLDSTIIGIWVDVDLGCPSDDYLGANPNLNVMYAYNQDAVDGQPGNTCQGVPTFPVAAPVQSITFLNHPLSKFIAPSNGGFNVPPATTDPTTASEIYNYMSGTWRDGTPLTYGGSGYNPADPNALGVSHCFPDSPNDPAGWSMCTANLPFSDRRMLGTTQLGLLLPGQIEELNTAWAFHSNPSLPCGLGTTFTDVATIKALYEGDFAALCSPLKASELPAESLQLFPNPTSDAAMLRYGALRPFSLRVFDAAGRMVFEKANGFEKEETKIETSSFGSGIYNLQIVTDQGAVTKKLAVMH